MIDLDARDALLLRAAVTPGRAGLDAWRQWSAACAPASGPADRLLPLVYANLSAQLAGDRWRATLERRHVATWIANQRLLAQAAPFLGALRAAGISSLLLKGAALVHVAYPDGGARPMTDVDVLVPHEDAARAVDLLLGLGFSPEVADRRALQALIDTEHGAGFACSDFGGVDLHWHLALQCWRGWDDALWETAQPVTLEDGGQSMVLAPAEQLLHVCVHGCLTPVYRDKAHLQWVADAMMVLRERAPIDWSRLVALARARKMAWIMASALTCLRDGFDAPVPADALAALAAAGRSLPERLEARTLRVRNGEARRLLNTVSRYLRIRANPRYRTLAGGLPRFLQHTWALDHGWQIAPVGAAKLLRKVGDVASRR